MKSISHGHLKDTSFRRKMLIAHLVSQEHYTLCCLTFTFENRCFTSLIRGLMSDRIAFTNLYFALLPHLQLFLIFLSLLIQPTMPSVYSIVLLYPVWAGYVVQWLEGGFCSQCPAPWAGGINGQRLHLERVVMQEVRKDGRDVWLLLLSNVFNAFWSVWFTQGWISKCLLRTQ